jgi:hypothetical protein
LLILNSEIPVKIYFFKSKATKKNQYPKTNEICNKI